MKLEVKKIKLSSYQIEMDYYKLYGSLVSVKRNRRFKFYMQQELL